MRAHVIEEACSGKLTHESVEIMLFGGEITPENTAHCCHPAEILQRIH